MKDFIIKASIPSMVRIFEENLICGSCGREKIQIKVIVMLWFISQKYSQTQFNQCMLNQRLDIQRVIDGLVKVFISGKNYYKCKELPILKRGHCYSFQCKFWNSFHFRKKKYA